MTIGVTAVLMIVSGLRRIWRSERSIRTASRHCPDAGGLGRGDECVEQQPADTATVGGGVDVHGMLDDARVLGSAGRAPGRDPSDDPPVHDRHQPLVGQSGRVERLPRRRLALERRMSGRDPGGMDARDVGRRAPTTRRSRC
jgi:hypothetical protein